MESDKCCSVEEIASSQYIAADAVPAHIYATIFKESTKSRNTSVTARKLCPHSCSHTTNILRSATCHLMAWQRRLKLKFRRYLSTRAWPKCLESGLEAHSGV